LVWIKDNGPTDNSDADARVHGPCSRVVWAGARGHGPRTRPVNTARKHGVQSDTRVDTELHIGCELATSSLKITITPTPNLTLILNLTVLTLTL